MNNEQEGVLVIRNRVYLSESGNVSTNNKRVKEYRCDGVYEKKEQLVREVVKIINSHSG